MGFRGRQLNDMTLFEQVNRQGVGKTRGINIRKVQSYFEDIAIYQCTASKWSILVGIIRVPKILQINRKYLRFKAKNKIIQMNIFQTEGVTFEQQIINIAVQKVLAKEEIAEPLDNSVFTLDGIFFQNCYVYFCGRTIQLKQFASFIHRKQFPDSDKHTHFHTFESFKLKMLKINRILLNKKLGMFQIHQDNISYSLLLAKPVLTALQHSRSLTTDYREVSILREIPPTMIYETEEFKNCRAMLQKPLQGQPAQGKVNYYKNDEYAMEETISWLEKNTRTNYAYRSFEDSDRQVLANQNVMTFDQLSPSIQDACRLSMAYSYRYDLFKKQIGTKFQQFVKNHGQKIQQLYRIQGRYRDRLELTKNMVKIFNTPMHSLRLCQLHLQLDEVTEAEKLLASLPQNLLAVALLKAKMMIKRNESARAVPLIQSVLLQLPTTKHQFLINTLFLLSEAYRQLNDDASAISQLEKCQLLIKQLKLNRPFDKETLEKELTIRINLANLYARSNPANYFSQLTEILKDQEEIMDNNYERLYIVKFNSLIWSISRGDVGSAHKLLLQCQKYRDEESGVLDVIAKQLNVITGKRTIFGHTDINMADEGETTIQETNSMLYLVRDCARQMLGQPILSFNIDEVVEYRKRLALRVACDVGHQAESLAQIQKSQILFNYNVKTHLEQSIKINIARLFLSIQSCPTKTQKMLVQELKNVSIQYFPSLNVAYNLLMGIAYYNILDFSRAIAHLEKCKSAGNLTENIADIMAEVQLSAGNKAHVRQMYLESLKKGIFKSNMLLFLAEYDESQQRYVQAIDTYKKYLRTLLESGKLSGRDIEYKIAQCYYMLADYDSALEYFLKAEVLNNSDIFRKIGSIYEKRQQYQSAFNYYSKLNLDENSRLNKQLAQVCSNISEVKQDASKYLTSYMMSLDKSDVQMSSDPQILKILVRNDQISLSTKIKCIRKFLRKNKKQDDVLEAENILADFLYQNQQYSEALNLYKRVIGSRPQLESELTDKILDCSVKLGIDDQSLYTRVLRVFETEKGQFAEETENVMLKLVGRMVDSGKYVRALILMLRCIQLHDTVFPLQNLKSAFKQCFKVAQYEHYIEEIERLHPQCVEQCHKIVRMFSIYKRIKQQPNNIQLQYVLQMQLSLVDMRLNGFSSTLLSSQ